jgi:hypothetical protein
MNHSDITFSDISGNDFERECASSVEIDGNSYACGDLVGSSSTSVNSP